MGAERAIRAEAGEPVRYRLSVADYLLLADAGVFGDGRTELIEGEIFDLSPVHRGHSLVLSWLHFSFQAGINGAGLPFDVFSPVSTKLDEQSMPQPDILVSGRGEGDYLAVAEVRIAVEVSDSTLRHDLQRKARLYARSGIPEYWVVDVRGARLIRLADPEGEEYRARDEFPFGAAVASVTLAGLVVDTARLTELG